MIKGVVIVHLECNFDSPPVTTYSSVWAGSFEIVGVVHKQEEETCMRNACKW